MYDPRKQFGLGPWPSHEEIDRMISEARNMRAEATAAFLGSAGRGIARLASDLSGRLGRMQGFGRARSKRERMTDSERTPADAGAARERVAAPAEIGAR